MNTWLFIALIFVAALSLLRITTQVRKATSKKPDSDWDSRFISQLRKAGIAPFDEYPVDFFFALPTAQACAEITAILEPEGYVVDSREEADGGGYSLHANRAMRLLVPDMQALTMRFSQLAEQRDGKYDGWAVAKGRQRGRIE
jgi:regulator of ribonuclease activity B